MPENDPAQTTADPLDELNLVNAGYVADLYEQYRADPASVDPEWRSLFDKGTAGFEPAAAPPAAQQWRPAGSRGATHGRRRGAVGAIGPGGSDPDQGSGREPGEEHDGQPGGADRDELP